jgi:hypothetical protein
MDRNRIEQPVLLLVEGKDEENFFSAFCAHLGIQGIQVISAGGKQAFKSHLAALKLLSGFDEVHSIGIVRDADGDPDGAFQSVCSSVEAAGLPKPSKALIPTSASPQITVLIMPPENVGTGRMLEDLCFASVADDPASSCVSQYFVCLGEQGIFISDNVLAKARVHTFLSSRNVPDLRLGEAALKGYWPWNDPVFDPVTGFLRQVALIGR